MSKPFNWRSFLTQNGIQFIERGPNVKRGEINIRCAYCRSADPSFHMGLNLTTGWWCCWRNQTAHSGKSPLRLIVQLLGVPYFKAREIAGLGEEYVDPEGFDAVAARLMGRGEDVKRPEQIKRQVLKPDRNFKPITERAGTRRWWNYLYDNRGFGHPDDVDQLCEQYHLMAARDGRWAGRLVIPYYLDGELVTWTGRALGNANVRYLDLSPDESSVPVKMTLYNADCMREGGEALVVQEGPVDVLKVDFYGKEYGVRSVGLSTNAIGAVQTTLLSEYADRFKMVIIMLDTATSTGIVDSMRMKQDLFNIASVVIALPVPYGLKDGAQMNPKQATQWAQQLARGLI